MILFSFNLLKQLVGFVQNFILTSFLPQQPDVKVILAFYI